MANISITRRCTRHCSYCFAKHELSRKTATDMPPEIYEAALAFLQRSGFPEARLLGGEPTGHPLFCEYLNRALDRGFRVVVFSGGLVPMPVLKHMADLPAEGFSMVLNAAGPAGDSEALVRRQREICRMLGAKVMLGVNILSSNDDTGYLFDWVEEYDLCRTVRVGIAHPIWGGTNDFFRLRGRRVISIFERLVTTGAEMGVEIGFDCGFTPCMFSREFVDAHRDIFALAGTDSGAPDAVGLAAKQCTATSDAGNYAVGLQSFASEGSAGRTAMPPAQIEAVGVRCSPVVDILPEGDCIACYALSRFRRFPLPSEGTRSDLVSLFDDELSPVLPAGVYRECVQCDYRDKGMCSGGCRARRAMRLRPNPLISLDP